MIPLIPFGDTRRNPGFSVAKRIGPARRGSSNFGDRIADRTCRERYLRRNALRWLFGKSMAAIGGEELWGREQRSTSDLPDKSSTQSLRQPLLTVVTSR